MTDDRFDEIRKGAPFAVRVTPNARREEVVYDPGTGFRVRVTVPPEGGKANARVAALLAKAIGVPKSRVVLVRGTRAREKLFRVDQD